MIGLTFAAVILFLVVLMFTFYRSGTNTTTEMFNPDDLRFHRVAAKPSVDLSFTKISDIKKGTSLVQISPKDQDKSSTSYEALVTAKDGKIFRVSSESGTSTEIFNLPDHVTDFDAGGEGGLLCIVGNPNSPTEYILSYTTSFNKGHKLHIQKCTLVESENGDVSSSKNSFSLGEMWFEVDYSGSFIHHSGTLAFDRLKNLFLGLGDGGPQGDTEGHAQNLQSLRGKIVNLGSIDKAPEPKIVAYGLRNPWKFSIYNSQMFIGDVGHNNVESLYLLPNIYPGEPYNCGWNQYEGSSKYAGKPNIPFEETLPPIFEYHNSTDNDITPGRAIIGGYFIPEKNLYIFGDYVSQRVYALQPQRRFDLSQGETSHSEMWIQVGSAALSSKIQSFGIIGLASKTGKNLVTLAEDGIYSIHIKHKMS